MKWSKYVKLNDVSLFFQENRLSQAASEVSIDDSHSSNNECVSNGGYGDQPTTPDSAAKFVSDDGRLGTSNTVVIMVPRLLLA